MNPRQYVTTAAALGGVFATAKAFTSLEVGAIFISGSASAIAIAGAFVLAAGAAGYGLGTLFNKTIIDPVLWD